MAKLQNMRGLQNFISDIRACANKEHEKTRVDKELGKIRKKFASGGNISEYDKKKYVWKLLYIFMLGYDVEFGHKQAADLIPATKYAEKQVGYMACAILLNEKDEFLRLIINSIRNDLISKNEAFQCLALGFVGNVGGQEMASLLAVDVMNLLTNGAVRAIVRKKAALCLLRLLRKAGPEADILQADTWSVKMANLLEERDPGVLLAIVTLLLGIVSRSYEGYEGLLPKLVAILDRLKKREVQPDYTYYGIASPWLQVKCLRVLQYFPITDDPALLNILLEILRKIITGTEVAKNINKNNANHAIVFEAIALALALEADTELLTASVGLLGKFISVREPNIKYLGLENMVRLAEVPAVNDAIVRHQKSIVASLKDTDVSIRRRALDLLFTMCNRNNARDIIHELLEYLEIADFSLREELVLKTAVLAERFFPDLHWYVDVMLTLIDRAGEFASKDIWHSTVQIISNNEDLHEYGARKVYEALQRGSVHEALVCTAGYVLGDYGNTMKGVPPSELFALLQERFPSMPPHAKGILLSAYLKLCLMAPQDIQLKEQVMEVLSRYARFMDADLQQRAVEYMGLVMHPDVAKRNVASKPPWEKRGSLLLRRLMHRAGGEEPDEQEHKPVWMQDENGDAVESPTAVQFAPPQAVPTSPSANGHADDDLLGEEAAANGDLPPASIPQPVDPLADLYGLQTGPAPAQALPAGPADPFSVSGDPYALTGGQSGADLRPSGDTEEWFRRLCASSNGVLYEDSCLQIGVRSEGFRGPSGQLLLFFGNKADAFLERLLCVVPPTPQFQFQLGAVPARLEPKKQIQVPLMVACVSTFLDAPRLQISYTLASGQQCNQSLRLPLTVNKFCRAPENAIPADMFFTRWRTLAGPPQKVGERITRTLQLSKPAVEKLILDMGLGPQPGLDPSPDNLVAAATFCFAPPGQQPQQVACMVRIEIERTRRLEAQVTVATPDVNVTASLKNLLVQLITKL
ncbi:hypothetical protein WJX74_004023 [Apatococcus lobatus]|uniref:AP-2 complex subunit alpha n=1 Tax=Apatococcus lobatus TaxID=904363 RepID=A0AAW1S779_9CHLO